MGIQENMEIASRIRCVGKLFQLLEEYQSIAVLGIDIQQYIAAISEYVQHNYPLGQRSGIVFSDGELFPALSVLDNVLFFQQERVFWSRKKQTERFLRLLEEYSIRIDPSSQVDDLPVETRIILNLIRAYLAEPEYLIVEDCMANVGLHASNVYCKILERIRRSGCKVLYLTTRWEDAVKTSERIAVVLDDEIEKNFDAAYVRNNPWELVQMLESGTYRGGESSRDFLQAMESIVQSTSEIFGSGNRSLEELAEVMRRSLNCGGSYIYVQGQHKAIETPAGQATGLNYERLGELVSQKSGAVFYGTIRDGYFSDLFLERPKQIRTVLVLPVVCHNDLIGHCGVWFDSVYFYSQEDLLMLSALANEIALAMETSRLMSRSVLLQESHHRIKNNLQMIISLLYMQKEQLRGDKAVSDIVDATISRIKSISSVHDLLSASTHGSGLISLKEMTERILRTYQSMGIEFHVQIDDIYSAQRLSASVALVINELVSNCFKHAFAGMDAQAYKQVNVSINMQGEQVCLCVQDNGVGFSHEAAPRQSLGMTILYALVEREMGGTIQIKSENGTTVKILLPACDNFTKIQF